MRVSERWQNTPVIMMGRSDLTKTDLVWLGDLHEPEISDDLWAQLFYGLFQLVPWAGWAKVWDVLSTSAEHFGSDRVWGCCSVRTGWWSRWWRICWMGSVSALVWGNCFYGGIWPVICVPPSSSAVGRRLITPWLRLRLYRPFRRRGRCWLCRGVLGSHPCGRVGFIVRRVQFSTGSGWWTQG